MQHLKIKNYPNETEKIMKDRFYLFLTIVFLFTPPHLNAQNYTLVFKHIDKYTFWLPLNLSNHISQEPIFLSKMEKVCEEDQLRSLLISGIDSCVVYNDTLFIYYNPMGLTVFIDTITSLYYFEISGTTNDKRNFSLSLPLCDIVSDINILIIESYITQYKFAKKRKNRYMFIGSDDIRIDLNYIKTHNIRMEYTTIRA